MKITILAMFSTHTFSGIGSGNHYRPHSIASEGYVFTGVCHSFCSTPGGGGGKVVNTKGPGHNPPPRNMDMGPGHNTPLPPGTWTWDLVTTPTHPPPPRTWTWDLVTTPTPPDMDMDMGPGHNTPPTWDMVTTPPPPPPETWSQHPPPSPPPPTWDNGHNTRPSPPPDRTMCRWAVRILLECILVDLCVRCRPY